MYKCPKCGENGRPERIENEDMEGNSISSKTGDIKCDDCGYIGSNTEFSETNEKKED